jgi:hypothetical protein
MLESGIEGRRIKLVLFEPIYGPISSEYTYLSRTRLGVQNKRLASSDFGDDGGLDRTRQSKPNATQGIPRNQG